MKAVILINPYLQRESEFYQPRRIREELELLGVSCDIVPNAWTVSVGEDLRESLTDRYDFCVYLDKDKYTPRALEAKGMRLFNSAEAVETCDDKALTHIALAGAVPMPRTYFAPLCYRRDASVDPEQLPKGLTYPIVVKECFGSFGEQVYLAQGEEELLALLEELRLRPHLLQEFVQESAGRDVRVVCVGGEPIACMERRSDTDFRSNIAKGGHGYPFSITEEISRLSHTVSERLGLDYCGIDLLPAKGGFLVCEVNSNAFFGGIESVTGINVAEKYAAYMVRRMTGRI